jgi:hypothetical protein
MSAIALRAFRKHFLRNACSQASRPQNCAKRPCNSIRVERLNSLPKAQQKIVMQMLDGVLSQTKR